MVEAIQAANTMVYHPKTESGKKTGRVVGAGMYLLALPNTMKTVSQMPGVKALPKPVKIASAVLGAVTGLLLWGGLGGLIGRHFDKQHDKQCKMFEQTV